MKEAFLLKSSWKDIFTNISDKQAGMLIKALYQFNCTDIAAGDIVATLADVEVRAYFNIMVLDCIKFQEGYDRRCETSRENGKKGGRPKKPKKNLNNLGYEIRNGNSLNNSCLEKPKKPNSKPNKPNNLKKPENENDNDNDLTLESSNEDSSSGGSPPDAPEKFDYKKFVDWFNSETQGVFGIVKYPLGDKRKASIRARVREHGKKSFFEVIKRAKESDFLKGQSQNGFTATLDWLIKPANFEKVLSGNYDNKRQKTVTIID